MESKITGQMKNFTAKNKENTLQRGRELQHLYLFVDRNE
jgi:hypothetical protein